jgi:hypothetical protein
VPPSPEPATLVTRNIPAADYQRLKDEAAERGLSMEALSRQLIHELAERRRLAERASAMRAYTQNPNRPSLDPDELIEDLRAARSADEKA